LEESIVNQNQINLIGSKILVVDDLPDNLNVLRETLEPEGYKLFLAPSGEIALRIAQHQTPDLILLDVMMPGIDGFETCRQLKRNESTRDIPVIFITAKDDAKDVLEGFAVGGVDYITKPFQNEVVLARTKTHLKISKLTHELAEALAKTEVDLKVRTEELQHTTAEKESLQKELEMAKDIHQSFLPEDVPEIKGIELAASSLSAKEVGGDFYDFIPIAEDKWGIVVADVSGKGMPAALFMALSRTLIRASTTENPTVANAIEKANEMICAYAQSSMFVTLFYAIIDSQKMNLKYINAGHNPPLLFRKATSDVRLLKAEGIVLGAIEDIELQEVEVELTRGDIIALFTDGVTEAIDEKEEEFGEERLIKVIRGNRTLSAQDLIVNIQEGVMAFAGEQPQFDDITLMVLKVTE